MSIANTGLGVGTGDWTVEYWVRYDGAFTNSGAGSIFTQNEDYSTYAIRSNFTLDGMVHTYTYDESTGNSNVVNGYSDSITDGRWHHVAFSYGAGTLKTYTNGVLSGTYSGGPDLRELSPMAIGEPSGYSSYEAASVSLGPIRFSSEDRYPTGFTPAADWANDQYTIAQYLTQTPFDGITLTDEAGGDNTGTHRQDMVALSDCPLDDADADGTPVWQDCDDSDTGSTIIANDVDCDGVLTASDCDDNDPTLGDIANDADCDGALTALDCDDSEPSLGDITLDPDCDGVFMSVSAVRITPDPATASDTLSCDYTFSDSSSASDSSFVQWQVNGVDVGYTKVATGRFHSCALTHLGNLVCWGIDDGSGSDDGQVTGAPTGASDYFLDVASSRYSSCAITAAGDVSCWGKDESDTVSGAPTGSGYYAIYSGVKTFCAVDNLENTTCWGLDGDEQASSAPADLTEYSSFGLGLYHGCAATTDFGVECWGITDGTTQQDYGQVTDTPSWLDYLSAVCGWYHSCALTLTGDVDCWGNTTGDSYDYGQVSAAPAGSGFTDLWGGGKAYNCVADPNGNLTCWGSDPGYGIAPTGPGYSGVSMEVWNACALTLSGAIECWGTTSGQWNFGVVANTPVPLTAGDQLSPTYFQSGDAISCTVIASDGVTLGNTETASTTVQ